MALSDELAFADATRLAGLVQAGEVEPIELVDTAVERIERLNPKLNAVVTPMYDLARASAAGDLPDGPFSGVPFLLSDLLAEYAGIRFTEASSFLKDFVPQHDSEMIARLKRAGLIIIGKTNTSEFGLLPTTESRLFGPCRNPWDPNRTPGGACGGAAAAVSSGMVPMAYANDGGGSIRIPASCCGLFGLKPTRARNPLGPEYGGLLFFLVSEHAVTRSVRDSAALLDATCGPDLGDSYWAPPRERPYVEEINREPGKLSIAFSEKPATNVSVHPDCVEAVQNAARLCADLGHEVVEASPTIDGEAVANHFGTLWSIISAWGIDYWSRRLNRLPSEDQFEELTWALYQRGQKQTAVNYMNALHSLEKNTQSVARFFTTHDVWLTPTLNEPPLPLGSLKPADGQPLAGWFRAGLFTTFTSLSNVTGQPAMSVPLYWNELGLPIGTQFTGRFGAEATLFRLAAQLEQASPWVDRRPPIQD